MLLVHVEWIIGNIHVITNFVFWEKGGDSGYCSSMVESSPSNRKVQGLNPSPGIVLIWAYYSCGSVTFSDEMLN